MRSTLHDPLLTPENRLWRAVLEQAYADAESGGDSDAGATDVGEGSPERIRARYYLRGDNKQEVSALALVCGFAEVPADRVLRWARKNYPRPTAADTRLPDTPTREPLAIGFVGARHGRVRSCAQVPA
jgi:hypothetical protein